MRQSTAPSRKSHGPGLSSAASAAAAQAKLIEKKKEFEAISALARSSALMVQRIEGLGDDCDTMADAGLVAGREKQGHIQDEDANLDAQDGDLLVRVPIEKLQEIATGKPE